MKQKFYVSVTEMLNRVVCVEAETKEEAENIAEDAYFDEQIVLTENDYIGYDIQAEEDQENCRESESEGEYFQHIK